MQRATLNLILDFVLLVVFSVQLWVTVAVDLLFPSPTHSAGWNLLGRSYDEWSVLRLWSGLLLAVLILLHVMLHWSWVCGIVAKKLSGVLGHRVVMNESTQTLMGVAFFVAVLHILGGGYLIASFFVTAPGSR